MVPPFQQAFGLSHIRGRSTTLLCSTSLIVGALAAHVLHGDHVDFSNRPVLNTVLNRVLNTVCSECRLLLSSGLLFQAAGAWDSLVQQILHRANEASYTPALPPPPPSFPTPSPGILHPGPAGLAAHQAVKLEVIEAQDLVAADASGERESVAEGRGGVVKGRQPHSTPRGSWILRAQNHNALL